VRAWATPSFEIESQAAHVPVGVDGEALVFDPPLRFALGRPPSAVESPATTPAPPAACMPARAWETFLALIAVAAGRASAIGRENEVAPLPGSSNRLDPRL
jgi:hypothetical protein